MDIRKPKPTGVIAAGNFIVDSVNIVDEYPLQDELTIVRDQTRSNGGGPYNLLRGLAALGAKFPLQAVGLVGEDALADWIIRDCAAHGIATDMLAKATDVGTSWTEVMSVRSTGRRTFFHYPGANAKLDLNGIDFSLSNAKIFYLGYLTMLDALDASDADGRTMASHVLERAGKAGLITVSDLVSRHHPDFRGIVASAAPHLDYLFLNELEAGWLLDRDLSAEVVKLDQLAEAAEDILGFGVKKAVVLHCAQGAAYAGSEATRFSQPAVDVPTQLIQSTVAAGDAFAAGFIQGLHEGRDAETSLLYAVSAAASCITSDTATDGIGPIKDCLALAETHGFVRVPK